MEPILSQSCMPDLARARGAEAPAGPPGLTVALARCRLSRRQAVWLFGASVAGGTGALSGCAQSPVTGQQILVGMGEGDERRVDAQASPHQFSQDLGAVQDEGLNRYVGEVLARMAPQTHRPQMPYSARVVNANHVNAYTFPAGSMALTRGIVIDMQDEAELAALLGHEAGHVNARHTAQRQGQALVAGIAMAGLSVATQGSDWQWLAGVGAQIGASALLASYSRDNEREADALGQRYAVAAGYPASGLVRLHQTLLRGEQEQPSLLAAMFSTHPMTAERVQTAQRLAQEQFPASAGLSPQRERYMDQTARLRALKPCIQACQRGETELARKRAPQAAEQFEAALRVAPRDYAAHLRMAQTLQLLGRTADARRHAAVAREVYPQEAQAHKLGAVLALQARDPAQALAGLEQYDRLLPGDPGVAFLRGAGHEALGQRQQAAQQYALFLRSGAQGEPAQYARSRLQAWGMLR